MNSINKASAEMSLIRNGFDLLLHGQETVQQSKKIVGVEDQQIHRRQRNDGCLPHTEIISFKKRVMGLV